MPIYLGWSGQASYKVAQELHKLVRTALPGQDSWVSAEDIQDGARWSPELVRILDQASFCIICVDPSNFLSHWLHFEVGAIAKATSKWQVRIFLNELIPSDLRGPLTLFQAVRLEKGDVQRLFEDIHANLTQATVSHINMVSNLETAWPEFLENVTQINLTLSVKQKDHAAPAVKEKPDLMLNAYINEIDEKILALLCVNDGLEEEKIATTVYLPRGVCQQHLIDLENQELVWSNLLFGMRRWFITDLGKRYLPAFYQD